MKEFENHHHYSEQKGHRRRSWVNKEMLIMERKGLGIEEIHTIKQGMRRIRRDGR